jgi:hypothetical protein
MESNEDEEIKLEKLVGRQRRPKTGDIFRVRVIGGEYYFGLVVDGDMEIGPFGPGSILTVVFEGATVSGTLEDMDRLCERPLLMPPQIVNQRPWTLGYAEKIGTTDYMPEMDYMFEDLAFGKFVDRYGNEIKPPPDNNLVGWWALGNEWTLADVIVEALNR